MAAGCRGNGVMHQSPRQHGIGNAELVKFGIFLAAAEFRHQDIVGLINRVGQSERQTAEFAGKHGLVISVEDVLAMVHHGT
ncbi:hypothetical protein SDC9_166836 [bioreactor metagenome]|uniref:Uncharacterized protein n=1 Tax=bioreactor metagenome TaxID=1076179 RepID=A0A645FY45_9ZZZZ